MLVAIHMKSGKTITVKTTNGQAPILTMRLESILTGSYVNRMFGLDTEVNCDQIIVRGINYRRYETRNVWLIAEEVEFVQFAVPTSQDS